MHWLAVLFGDEVVELEAFGIRAGRNSRGHRFMHDKLVWIGRPDEYVEALRAAFVLARRAGLNDPLLEDFYLGLTDEQQKAGITAANKYLSLIHI